MSLAGLTQTQRRIAEEVARGLRTNEIARNLDLAPQTVKNHLTAIFVAVGVRNRTELAVRVLAEGQR